MLEFSKIPGLTKIFNKDDWKKVFHACAELPNYRETKYSSYFVTTDAETRASKLYYAKNELEKGGISYDPVSHTALTHENDFGAGKPYEFGKFYMVATIDPSYTKMDTSTAAKLVFESGYLYSKATPYGFSLASNSLQPSDDASQCSKDSVYYLTAQVACESGTDKNFLDGVRYAWDTGDGQGLKECTKGSVNWANRTYQVGKPIANVIDGVEGRIVYALPTYLSSKGAGANLYRYQVDGNSKFASNTDYRRKLPTFKYDLTADKKVEFELTTDECYREGRYYYNFNGTKYVRDMSVVTGKPVTGTKYVAKRYFVLNATYSLVTANEYFNGTADYYFMYTGNSIYTAVKDREYTEGSQVPANSFYRKKRDGDTAAELYTEVGEEDKLKAYNNNQRPVDKSWYTRGDRTGFIFCKPIGATSPGTYASPYFLYRNGNHLYYKDDLTTFYLISSVTGNLSSVTYLTEGIKTWNYQIQDATDLYFKRSHTYYTDQEEQEDVITGEYDLEANVRALVQGYDYEVGKSIASWKAGHSGRSVYQHLTNFYVPTPDFVGQITHGTEFYERAGTNFPYEGFVAVATEMGAEQARGALYRCKRRVYELTEDEHHHYTGDYVDSLADETSKTYYEYNTTTGEYTPRTPGYGSSDKVYRNYDGSSFNQVTMDYVFQDNVIYFKNEACRAEDKLVAGDDYVVGNKIADWVKAVAGRTTPYVTNRQFYYRNGWTFTPITGNRYGVTTDKRFQAGKDYFWYTGANYEFSRVEVNNNTEKIAKKAVIDDTIFGYHNEDNDIYWGYTALVEGEDYTVGADIATWISDHPGMFQPGKQWLYRAIPSVRATECTDINDADIDWVTLERDGVVDTPFYKKVDNEYIRIQMTYDKDTGDYYLDGVLVEWSPPTSPKALGYYESTGGGNIIDKDTHINTGNFVAGKQYHYRNYDHIADTGTTDVPTNLYRFINQDQKIEEDAEGKPKKMTIAQSDLGTAVPHKVYTRYWDDAGVTELPTYYYISDLNNSRWNKKFSIFYLDDAEISLEDTASQTSYWYSERGEYTEFTVEVGDDLEPYRTTHGTLYKKAPTYTYVGRATSSQPKIIYIDPTEAVNKRYNNRGTMITEVPICIPYAVDSTTGCNTRGDNMYGNGEEIPASPRIYLESKNGETLLPDEYYEEVYGSYYWDQFFLDHGISANPIEDVCAYFMEGSYLFMKWKDPTIMIPSNNEESLASDLPPDAWYRTTITITDADGADPLTVYVETTCNEFSNDFLRLAMSATAGTDTFERKLYDRITAGGIIHLTAVSQTGTNTTYHIKPSKIVWAKSDKELVSLTTGTALPNMIYYDYDTWKKDGSFVELPEVYPYYTPVAVNQVGGAVCRFTRDFPAYKKASGASDTEVTPALVGNVAGCDVNVGDVVPSTGGTEYYMGYHPVPEITWSELVQLGFFDQLCSAGYSDVTDSGVQRHVVKEINVRMKSVGSEITIPWYTGATATTYAKIMDTDSVIATRDVEMGYVLTTDTEPQMNKTYYTRKCTSLRSCWSGVNTDGSGISGDNYEYEPWFNTDKTSITHFTNLKAAGKLYEHASNFPHYQHFFKRTIGYNLTSDTVSRAGVTYYARSGGQTITGVGTIETYLHPFSYRQLVPGTQAQVDAGKADYVIGGPCTNFYVQTTDPSYSSYEAVNLGDPNWLISLKDPRFRSVFLRYPNGTAPYYQQVPNKEHSATFRFKNPYMLSEFGDDHTWGVLNDDGTYTDSTIRETLHSDLADASLPTNWYKFYHEAVCNVINPVVVDRYIQVDTYPYTTDARYISDRVYYVPGTTAGTYRALVVDVDYIIGNDIPYDETTDTTVVTDKRYYRRNTVTGEYKQVVNNTDYALATETTVDPNKSYYAYNEATGEFDPVEPATGADPSAEGWYYSYTVTNPVTAGWYEREVFNKCSEYSPMPGSLINSQTMDKLWIPSLNQIDVTRSPHPTPLEGAIQSVLAPVEGSPLYYYQTKINGYGYIYKFLVALNASGAAVNWWCRTAIQNTIGATAEGDTTTGPYITSGGAVALKDADTNAYVYPFFTIA